MRKRNESVSCKDCPYFCWEWCVRYPEHKAIEHPSLYFCGEHPDFLCAVVDDDEERPTFYVRTAANTWRRIT